MLKKPDCETCGAKEQGWINVSGMWICGECVMELQNIKKKEIKNIINETN